MRPTSSLLTRPGYLTLALCLLLTGLGSSTCQPAPAAEDQSLDSIWMDQADKTTKKAGEAVTQPATKAAAATTRTTQKASGDSVTSDNKATESSGSSSDTFAPLCNVDEFKNSALISRGGWPGTGPFKNNDNTSYTDDHQNKVALELSGDAITRAQMTLSPKPSSGNLPKDLLDMQMNIDFLLEAVGIKPQKIQQLNLLLEQNKGALLRNDESPLNLTTGRYLINISKNHQADSSVGYVVAVNSLDADKRILQQHSLSDGDSPRATDTDKHSARDVPKVKTVEVKPAIAVISQENLKEQFLALIKEWQTIKKNAVRSRQTENLATVLAGKALVRQTDAVKWLLTNKKYYEMNPRGVQVERFTEVTPAKKYAVAAQVHEAYKFVDETTGQVLKEVDDINRVTYTVEKANGRWVITDSALQANNTQATKSSPTSKTPR